MNDPTFNMLQKNQTLPLLKLKFYDHSSCKRRLIPEKVTFKTLALTTNL